MRQCISDALSKQLVGGEGHDMRIAIVGEALAAGKCREEIIQLFENQADFDEATTAKNVDYIISKGYRPWKCETLRERCSSLVDCERCPMLRFESPESVVEQASTAR
jgi:DNA primase large subunit